MADLTCKLFKKNFSNPIWVASGTITEKKEKVDYFLKSSAGIIIPRTTRLKHYLGRTSHPSYHLDINYKEKSIRNCEWTGEMISYWEPFLSELAETEKVVMSVSGREIKDCLKVCKIIDRYNFPLIEINISCAHSNSVNGFINRNARHIELLVKTLKKDIKTPISLKLGHSDFIVELARIAEKAGVDAITAINTVGPVLDFNLEKGKPELKLGINSGLGGLSGKPIFNLALTDVALLSQNLKIPVLASGGVNNIEEVIKMIMAGASVVQIYSAVHLAGKNKISFLNNFVRELSDWMDLHNYPNIGSFRGLLLKKMNRGHQMKKKIPVYDKKLCHNCDSCIRICLENAIKKNKIIDKKKCTGCGACVSVCPTGALK